MKFLGFSLIWAWGCLLEIHALDLSGYGVSHPNGSRYASCRKPEMCVSISTCPSMRGLLINQGRDREIATSLQKMQCGIEENTPKVCCPDSLAKLSEDFSICGKAWSSIRHEFPRNSYLGYWPWMAALNSGPPYSSIPDFKCTATLISRQWLIIAAHCIALAEDFKNASIRIGVTNLDSRVNNSGLPIDVPVTQIITHPEYSANPPANDIALVQIKYPLHYTANIRPSCLLSGPEYQKNEYYFRKKPFVVGWGINNNKQTRVTQLQETAIRIVNASKCEQQYGVAKISIINENVLCAGESGKDDCQLDPGAVLIFPNTTELNYKLGGIASYGTDKLSCAQGRPGVYTKIPEFVDWISQVTGIKF